jgi:hypothetical protein
MTKHHRWKVTLNVEVDGQSVELPVGVDLLRDIINSCPDTEANSPLFEIMAQHPSSGVRQNVAAKECLSESAIAKLSEDADIGVMRSLCSNAKFRLHITEDIVLHLIATDRDCAEMIADNVDGFQNCDVDRLIKAFLSSADPERRLFLVNSYRLPAKLPELLREDPDPSVAAEAKRRLTGC